MSEKPELCPNFANPFGAKRLLSNADMDCLYRQNYRKLRKYAERYTHNPADAEDAVQNVFLKLVRGGLPLDEEQNSAGYLYRCTINEARKIVRSRRFGGTAENLVPLEEALETPVPQSSLEASTLLDMIAELEPADIELMRLHYDHGYTDAEIADKQGRSRGAVAIALNRVRGKLGKLMDGPKTPAEIDTVLPASA